MVITLVMDQYGAGNNGTTMTAIRFAEILKKHGHTVKVITSSPVEEDGVYVLPEWKMPVFNKIVHKQGMQFADPDTDIIREAIEGSDVVHMLMPFMVQSAAKRVADDLHIATTAAFHIQPENYSYSIHMGKIKPVNKLIYYFFRKRFYVYYNHIHVPSEMMRDLLVDNKYKGHIHPISNGVTEDFKRIPCEKPDDLKGKYVILMIGRLSREKRQDLIIKAIGESPYNDKIQLILAGKGPTQKSLERLSEKYLKNPVRFTFLPKDELIKLINYSDLYVHASDAESEAISCIEAFTCGLVPVISDSKVCATKQFALSEHNLFRKGNYKSLREKIEWFYEHPEEKARMAEQYIEYAKKFTIEQCVRQLEDVFTLAIAENKAKWENVERERRYLSDKTEKEKKAYQKQKQKYKKLRIKSGMPDFTESYITTIDF